VKALLNITLAKYLAFREHLRKKQLNNMRRKVKNRNIVGPDAKYNSTKVSKFINYVMEGGKKNTARDAFEIIKEKLKVEDPMETFEAALRNAGPVTEVRSRRIGGANYQVPREVREERRFMLALRWILEASNAKKGKAMRVKLAEELMAAANNEGSAVKKKEDTHRMAESNKAFAHFAW
jgi:small subunit ribosomal protein S7